jgi:tetratricopeptide (TPR) repeat protein
MTSNFISILESSTPMTAIERVGDRQISVEASAHFRKGTEWLALGESEHALAAFEHALEHAPDYSDAHIGMGIAHALCSNIYPAIDHLQLATEVEPSSFYAHFKLSQLYFKLRVPAKGYEAARAALNCSRNVTERQIVSQLLREERAREHDSIARPLWNRPFGTSSALAGALAVAATVIAVLIHLH